MEKRIAELLKEWDSIKTNQNVPFLDAMKEKCEAKAQIAMTLENEFGVLGAVALAKHIQSKY